MVCRDCPCLVSAAKFVSVECTEPFPITVSAAGDAASDALRKCSGEEEVVRERNC